MNNHPPSIHQHQQQHHLYPAHCFGASPTYNKWVKLTATDVHALRREPGFEIQNIHFHLNHPIRFVYLCGVVTEIEYLNDWFTLLTLDDGSGRSVECKIVHVLDKQQQKKGGGVSGSGRVENARAEEYDRDEDDAFWLESAKPNTTNKPTTTVIRTQTADLTIHISPFSSNAIYLSSTHQEITIGTTLKAKGTLSIFRNTFQLNLLRAFIVKDVDTELEVWEGYAQFCSQVLSKPWVISREEVSRLEMEEKRKMGEERRRARKERERAERKRVKEVERRREWEEKVRRKEEKREARRVKEERELNGRPLKGL